MRPSRSARTVAALAALTAITSVPAPASAGARPEVAVYDTTVNESMVAERSPLVVRLAEKATSRVTVTWRTEDGTARAGNDYKAKSDKVVFEKGQLTKKIKMAVADDDRPEATEYFYVAFASKQARVTTRRATVSIIDDDAAQYTGDLTFSGRREVEANGFYTLETWTLTFRPELVPMYQGTQWYDDGYGYWSLTGSRVLEDHRPGAPCRTLEKEMWTGDEGEFFTELHPDSDVTTSTGNLVLQSFFPQYGDNLGFEPLIQVTVDALADGTQYSYVDGDCVASSYESVRRISTEGDVPGTVVASGRGRIVRFDHHVLEDNTTTDGLDKDEVWLLGDLAPKAG